MFQQKLKTKTIPFLIFILFYVTVFGQSNTLAQDIFKVNDSGPGGGGSTTFTTTSLENDKDKTSTIWILMGITTGLVLFYKFFIQKKKTDDEINDSTSTSILFKNNVHIKTAVAKIKDVEKKSPFNLYLGIRRDDPVFNKKTYLLGVSFNL
ncbi:MAG: hypothetical protein COW08_06755 [Ignavibacteriales bacterium CG12_big_fil_rev_8_21_14_0_65_30_8]|nr:MAG: hypothetical protein COW08_06755 [Ignavibacteriales bacterium CG12_big_fil_rev_8_21_14_0_65_30_8]